MSVFSQAGIFGDRNPDPLSKCVVASTSHSWWEVAILNFEWFCLHSYLILGAVKSDSKSSNSDGGFLFLFWVSVDEEYNVGNLRSIQLDLVHQKDIFNL